MPIEDDLRARISQLLDESAALAGGDEHGQCVDERQQQLCSAWITAAHNAVHIAISDSRAPYRQKVDKVAVSDHGYAIHTAVGELRSVLRSLLAGCRRLPASPLSLTERERKCLMTFWTTLKPTFAMAARTRPVPFPASYRRHGAPRLPKALNNRKGTTAGSAHFRTRGTG